METQRYECYVWYIQCTTLALGSSNIGKFIQTWRQTIGLIYSSCKLRHLQEVNNIACCAFHITTWVFFLLNVDYARVESFQSVYYWKAMVLLGLELIGSVEDPWVGDFYLRDLRTFINNSFATIAVHSVLR